MKEIQYEIVKEIAVLSKGDSGYTKEINLISWNGREPKYDIRSFSPNREKCGKGITLNADEAAALLEALQKEVNSGDCWYLIDRAGRFQTFSCPVWKGRFKYGRG